MSRTPFLTADWRYLVMLNYEIAPDVLASFLPSQTSLDLWHGRALVSVVGFRFLRTRVAGVAPLLFHQQFEEVNLRFYVRREMPDGTVRRGVTFVRELVPKALVASVARIAYNEPYRALPMRSECAGGGDRGARSRRVRVADRRRLATRRRYRDRRTAPAVP
jgi:uncharacterized protein YqjF (DUF2071 family)